ncbi:MAG: class I SAM-dependent methyltransferase [Frankiaceae bacterium]|jgi:SAM-dependent methyltransferase|nr:class I SAM-dependent methyltransferase [Frankiaceae bacterium]
MSAAGHEDGQPDAIRFWEERYRAKGQIWSGQVNPVFARIVGSLPPGRALDLGCGEGADAVWLAERGWSVTAVDISPTALARGAARAAELGVGERIAFAQHDLARSVPPGAWDLVSAQFLHSPLEFPKEQVLRAAAGRVAPGGLLLIVEHGAMPPWRRISAPGEHPGEDHHHPALFPTPQELLDSLALDLRGWRVVELAAPSREAVGPDGQRAELVDNVVAICRDS